MEKWRSNTYYGAEKQKLIKGVMVDSILGCVL